jgi:hypothetical protein
MGEAINFLHPICTVFQNVECPTDAAGMGTQYQALRRGAARCFLLQAVVRLGGRRQEAGEKAEWEVD